MKKDSPPKAIILGSFGPPTVPSGLNSAMENLLHSPLGSRYRLLVLTTFRDQQHSRNLFQRLIYGAWLFTKTTFLLWVRRPALVDVHAVSGRDFLKNGVAVLAARAAGLPVLLRIHGGDFDRAFMKAKALEKRAMRMILRVADRGALLSRGWERIVNSLEPYASTVVLPNSVDCGAVKAVGHHNKDARVVLM